MRKLAPLRFVMFIVLLIGGTALFVPLLDRATGVMAGFDVAALAFLLSCLPLLNDNIGQMREASRDNDANRALLLGISVAVTIVILVSVGEVISRTGHLDLLEVLLVMTTLVLTWLFGNMVYALHYAHLYYQAPKGRRGDAGGISFPETKEPDYWDFIYFAFTLGMTFQTSDANITSKGIRRVVIGHCLAAFVFNLGVLAFTINTIGS